MFWMEGARVMDLRNRGVISWCFLTLEGEVAALRRFAGGKVLRLDWRFGGEHFFVTLVGRAGLSGLTDFLLAGRVWWS